MAREHAVIFRENLPVPSYAFTLEGFQGWVESDEFPDTGRVDFLAGEVETEMSPENLDTHAVVKTAIVITLGDRIVRTDLGEVYIDRTRVVSPKAGLSVEPDVVVVLWESLESGRVQKNTAALLGAPDLIVEILSDSSVRKDTEVLPVLYARAGVPELWLADARGHQLRFSISCLQDGRYVAVEPDAEGWTRSPRIGGSFRLLRHLTRRRDWRYVLEAREV